ncbi:hypothetical protein FACS189496_3780 [Bacilli bacterium]|nr:hypothetical protein FACS189496_3780 [Bacilli bacterium]
MNLISEIDIEFSSRIDPRFCFFEEILHYKGYRPNYDEFLEIVGWKYFQDKVKPPEVLLPQFYYAIKNNTELDNRVRTFMRDNKITLCETFSYNNYGGFTYIVNYSFDNYKTFGLITMDSSAKSYQL